MNIFHKVTSQFKTVKSYYFGQRTNRKIIVIESDDWGTIRSTKKANQFFQAKNMGIGDNPFNRFDILESAEDFTALYDTLSKYKDKNNQTPILTANTIVANPNFEKIEEDNFQNYYFENFTDTYHRYWSTNDTFQQFQEGITNRMLQPQFHGREHVNVSQWLKGLQSKDKVIRFAFSQQIFGVDCNLSFSKRGNFMATYDFDQLEDLEKIHTGISEGLDIFRQIFGMESYSTIAPAAVWHPDTEEIFAQEKVKYLQGYIIQNVPQTSKKSFEKIYHLQGEKNWQHQKYLVRNCYFEPSTNPNIDWVDKCLSQIKKAFLFRQPAVITSHRINFVGGIEEQNRNENLKAFDQLLKTIITKWPDVEFVASDELGQILEELQITNN